MTGEFARCRPWLDIWAQKDGRYTVEFIEAEIQRERMQFWPLRNACALTRVILGPVCKTLTIFAVAGERGEALDEVLQELGPRLDEFAKANACKWIKAEARPGWQKPCEPLGYKVRAVVLMKEVV